MPIINDSMQEVPFQSLLKMSAGEKRQIRAANVICGFSCLSGLIGLAEYALNVLALAQGFSLGLVSLVGAGYGWYYANKRIIQEKQKIDHLHKELFLILNDAADKYLALSNEFKDAEKNDLIQAYIHHRQQNKNEQNLWDTLKKDKIYNPDEKQINTFFQSNLEPIKNVFDKRESFRQFCVLLPEKIHKTDEPILPFNIENKTFIHTHSQKPSSLAFRFGVIGSGLFATGNGIYATAIALGATAVSTTGVGFAIIAAIALLLALAWLYCHYRSSQIKIARNELGKTLQTQRRVMFAKTNLATLGIFGKETTLNSPHASPVARTFPATRAMTQLRIAV